jgi:uracil-DNA glycosylase
MPSIGNDWDELLADELRSECFRTLWQTAEAQYALNPDGVFPPQEHVFRALKLTPYSKVRAVILGETPYPTPGDANGLSFAVNAGRKIPAALRNIFIVLKRNLNVIPPAADLLSWTEQGVLLLNTALTLCGGVDKQVSLRLWKAFTDRIIEILNERENPVVFMLWGVPAKAKAALIDSSRHLVLEGAHPTSRNGEFFKCRHFSEANGFLAPNAIEWGLPPRCGE